MNSRIFGLSRPGREETRRRMIQTRFVMIRAGFHDKAIQKLEPWQPEFQLKKYSGHIRGAIDAGGAPPDPTKPLSRETREEKPTARTWRANLSKIFGCSAARPRGLLVLFTEVWTQVYTHTHTQNVRWQTRDYSRARGCLYSPAVPPLNFLVSLAGRDARDKPAAESRS